VKHYFRNMRLYRVMTPWPESEAELSDLLNQAAFKPCGPYAERSAGFEAPVAESADLFGRRLMGNDRLQLRVQTRILPAGAVQEALVERVDGFKTRMGAAPNRRELRDLKDEVINQLMPQALVKSDRVGALYLREQKVLAVDSASETVADYFFKNLTRAVVGLQYAPLAFKQPAVDLMNNIFLGQAKPPFSLARECRMRDPAEAGASVNWLEMDLADAAIRRHLAEGLHLDRLGVRVDHVARLVLDNDLVVRKLRFEDQRLDDVGESDDPLAQADAEWIVFAGFLQQLIKALSEQLGGWVN